MHVLENFFPVNVFMLTYICYVSGMFLENFNPVNTSVHVDLYMLCFRHVFGEFQSC